MRQRSHPPYLVFFTIAFALALPISAQTEIRRAFDPEKTLLIPEIGVIVAVDDPATGPPRIDRVLPIDIRPEANRGIVVRSGDLLIMAEGRKLGTLADLRSLYDEATVGEPFKLAIRRGTESFLVGFDKAEAAPPGLTVHGAPGGGHAMQIVRLGDDGSGSTDVEVLPELGAVFRERGDEVVVAALLPGDATLHEGDVVSSLGSQEISDLESLRAAWDLVEIGERTSVTVRRGAESLTVDVQRSAATRRVVVQGEQ